MVKLMNNQTLAKIMSLVAEMEALKVEIEVLKREWPTGGEHLFQQKAEEIRAISEKLQNQGS